MKNNSQLHSLENQIRRLISRRIMLCCILLFAAVLVTSTADFFSIFQETKFTLNAKMHHLSDYIVAQALIDNTPAINGKLESTSNQSSAITFHWIATQKILDKPVFRWVFPFYWQYTYPIVDHDGHFYGDINASGSYFYNPVILRQLVIKLILLLLFFLTIFILLKPISKKIPEKLFIQPILEILSVLKNRKATKSELLFYEFKDIESKIHELLQQTSDISKLAAQEKIALQVAHDIRSPLAVLTQSLSDLSCLSEKNRINVRNAIQRVTDIANNLLLTYNNHKKHFSQEPVAAILSEIISEKHIQLLGSPISLQLLFLSNVCDQFAYVDLIEFKRVISNLLNNAIESFSKNTGEIIVLVEMIDEFIHIQIKDNGCGIPTHKLQTIQKGESFGKKLGSGLGLPNAIEKITEWGGKLDLHSERNHGTTVDIFLPKATPSLWFASAVTLTNNTHIIVLDDDENIHEVWNKRFSSFLSKENNISLLHFNNPDDFSRYVEATKSCKTIFLLDYEIHRSIETGLSLAQKYHLEKKTILVTSRYEDNMIRENCLKAGIQMIPKYFADYIPILMSTRDTTPNAHAVLIEDNKILANIWQESATSAKITLDVFYNPSDFKNHLETYHKNTTIYIDSFFDENTKGEDFAKTLYDLGYKNLVLTTGYPKQRFSHATWIKEVIGKNPPWE